MVMGHEFSGAVAEVGEGVTDIKVGDRVAAYPVIFCGDCEPCRQGNVHVCLHKKALGVLECNGAMAEYVALPAKLLFKLADTLSYEAGSMMEPLAVAYRGVNHAGELAGKNVFIVGAGTIGLLAMAVVKMRNPARIFVSDLSDIRLGVAKAMGADYIINPSKDNVKDFINQETCGVGVDVAFEGLDNLPGHHGAQE